VLQRHSDYFLDLVEHLEDALDGPDARRWHERIEVENDNLRGALRWLLESRQVELGLLFVGRLGKFWHLRGFGREALAHAEVFLSLPEATHRTIGRAMALNAASWLCHNHGDPSRIVPLADEACAIFEEHGDRSHLATALLGRGIGNAIHRNNERAQADWQRALPLFQEFGRNAYVVRVLVNLAELLYLSGDLNRSRALAVEGLALGRAGGHWHVTALALGVLGPVEELSGNDAKAAAHYRERLGIYRDLGLPNLIADTIEQLAGIAYGHGELERAARLLGAAEVLRERFGSVMSLSHTTRATRSLSHTARTQEAIRLCQDDQRDPTLRAAWIHGRTISLDEAIEYALEGDGSTTSEPAANAAAILTRRELDVVRLIVDGKSNQEIAEALVISPNTVATHVANIMNKLGVESRTAAATYAIRHGLA
jgi:DNA-binding CsgD family transcriptional regulator